MQIVFDLLLSFVACLDHFIAFLIKFLICLLNIFSFIAIYWHFNSFFFNRFIAVLYIPFHYKIYDFYRHLFVYSLNYYYCLDNIAFSQIIIWLLLAFLRNFYQEFSTSLDNFDLFDIISVLLCLSCDLFQIGKLSSSREYMRIIDHGSHYFSRNKCFPGRQRNRLPREQLRRRAQ